MSKEAVIDKAMKDGEQIIRATALKYGLSYEELVGRPALANIVRARYEAIEAVADKYYPNVLSLTKIGNLFNRRHEAICYALGNTARARKTERRFKLVKPAPVAPPQRTPKSVAIIRLGDGVEEVRKKQQERMRALINANSAFVRALHEERDRSVKLEIRS